MGTGTHYTWDDSLFDGSRTVRDISQILNIPERTVYKHAYRIGKPLKCMRFKSGPHLGSQFVHYEVSDGLPCHNYREWVQNGCPEDIRQNENLSGYIQGKNRAVTF